MIEKIISNIIRRSLIEAARIIDLNPRNVATALAAVLFAFLEPFGQLESCFRVLSAIGNKYGPQGVLPAAAMVLAVVVVVHHKIVIGWWLYKWGTQHRC